MTVLCQSASRCIKEAVEVLPGNCREEGRRASIVQPAFHALQPEKLVPFHIRHLVADVERRHVGLVFLIDVLNKSGFLVR